MTTPITDARILTPSSGVSGLLAVLPAEHETASTRGAPRQPVRPQGGNAFRAVLTISGVVKPDGQNPLAFRAFEQGIVAVLLSLYGKQLALIDRDATEVIALPGQAGRFASITAELTNAGREALL